MEPERVTPHIYLLMRLDDLGEAGDIQLVNGQVTEDDKATKVLICLETDSEPVRNL